jgi:hypothetical protein
VGLRYKEFAALFPQVKREALHLEMRDSYGTEAEPLSDYQRWAHSLTAPMVDAGEDIRWVPRARVSELMFPGNDFWLFDDELLVFMVFAGNGIVVDRPAMTHPELIARCRASFEAAWALSIPHHEYTPDLS